MTETTIDEMRERLLRAYPSGIIRSQFILMMSDKQIRAIHKWHTDKNIPLDKAREPKPSKQIPGQMSIF